MNKRNICLLLAFAMVLSLFAGLTPAVGAVPFAESIYGQSDALHPQTLRGDSGEDLMIDVYFVDRTDSNPAYAYYFNINGNSVDTSENLIWPGNRMKAAGVDMEGDNYYKVTLSSETYTHIIFNNGSSGAANQTGDLPFPTDSVPDPLNPNGNPFVVYCITRVNGVINCTQADDVWPSPPQETEATCTESGWRAYVGLRTGAYAGEETLPPLGHDWSSWETVMPPTCTETGEESRVCFRCGAEEFHTLDALGHQPGEPVEENRVEPTATEPGSYDSVVYCQRCSAELSRERIVLPATMNGFFLIGPNGWNVEDVRAEDAFAPNPGNAAEYVLSTTLQTGDPIKVVKVEQGAITVWYPDGMGNEYVVDAAHAGEKTVYFSESYRSDWADFGGYIWIDADPEPQEPILDPSLRLFYSVSTEIEISTQYSVIKSDVQSFDSWYVEISKLDADGNPTETKRFGEGQEGAVEEAGASVWSVNYVDVTAKEMGVPYRATLHAFEANGQEHYSESVTKTVREVLLEVVQDDRSTDERRTLAADMLNYGAAAQAY
ncbi:MAG: starch-binding protein, partial [Oscillospiraceae bacterium]|nr:starch-binding protein [Oscillospiraceae bacterium]